MTVNDALDAIDKRDYDTVESLRDRIQAEHIAPILGTWRRSLPWEAKDLYVALLMDQRDASLEPLMQDALDAPMVETRAYSICYLTGSFSKFDQLLAAGGWIDPAKVDARIAEYRESTGVRSKNACPNCGAAAPPSARACTYCGLELKPALAAQPDPGLFVVDGRHFEIRTGPPISKTDAELREVSSVVRAPDVAVKFRSMDQPFGFDMLVVRLLRVDGSQLVTLTASNNQVKPTSTTLYKSWKIPRPAEYEIHVLDAHQRLLAKTRVRIVPG